MAVSNPVDVRALFTVVVPVASFPMLMPEALTVPILKAPDMTSTAGTVNEPKIGF